MKRLVGTELVPVLIWATTGVIPMGSLSVNEFTGDKAGLADFKSRFFEIFVSA